MKKIFHKAMAISMAAVVLMTTLSFTIDMHYCGDSLIDFSFIRTANTCGMKKTAKVDQCTDTVSQKSCCTDHQIIIKGQDNLKNPFEKFSCGQQVFIAAFISSSIHLLEHLDESPIRFKKYHPPFLERDILCLNQTFLI